MTKHNELIVSASDAEMLASLVGDRRISRNEADAADALADALMEARMVPHERLPEDRVAMNTLVEYREEPGGARRKVALVHPGEANPSAGRISVLSPVGRALLGRRRGALASIDVPGGRGLTIRILEIGASRAAEVIIVTEADAAILAMLKGPEPLKRELERAVVVSSEAVPPDVATMNSQVRYTDETAGVTRTVALVYERPVGGEEHVSVLDPVGTALLGLSAGQAIEWTFPDGTRRRIRLDAVLHQPERARRDGAG